MSKVARLHLAHMIPAVPTVSPARSVYEEDSSTFEPGDLIYYRNPTMLSVWPVKERYSLGNTVPIPIDATGIESCVEWLAPVRALFGHLFALQFLFVFHFRPDHPLVPQLFGFVPPARWVALKASYRMRDTEPRNLWAVYSYARGHQRSLRSGLLTLPRNFAAIRNFFYKAESRVAAGTVKLHVYVAKTRFDGHVPPLMSLADDWKTTHKKTEDTHYLIEMLGPPSELAWQVRLIEQKMRAPYKMSLLVDKDSASFIAIHNLLVDLAMIFFPLGIPLYVLMGIAEYLPGVSLLSEIGKYNVLLHAQRSIRSVKEAPPARGLRHTRALTDVRWYEMSPPDAPVHYGRPNWHLAPDRQPSPAPKRLSSAAARRVKKANMRNK